MSKSKKVSVTLSEEEIKKLDEKVEEVGGTKASIIRILIQECLIYI